MSFRLSLLILLLLITNLITSAYAETKNLSFADSQVIDGPQGDSVFDCLIGLSFFNVRHLQDGTYVLKKDALPHSGGGSGLYALTKSPDEQKYIGDGFDMVFTPDLNRWRVSLNIDGKIESGICDSNLSFPDQISGAQASCQRRGNSCQICSLHGDSCICHGHTCH